MIFSLGRQRGELTQGRHAAGTVDGVARGVMVGGLDDIEDTVIVSACKGRALPGS
jgi:hypothetical protein